jgi:hypothetical protein
MASKTGYIRLHRKLTDWEWYSDHNTTRLFLHLLLTVNYKASKYQGYDVPAGGTVTGYPALARQAGLSIKNVRTALTHLKATGEVAVKVCPKFSIISITNWEEYQQAGSVTGSQVAGNRQATGSQVATSKEGNKTKKQTKDSNESYSEAFEDFWKTWRTTDGGGGGKFVAFGSWKKLNEGDRELASTLAVRFLAHRKKVNPDVSDIHASTYLNQHRWDEVQDVETSVIRLFDGPSEEERRARSEKKMQELIDAENQQRGAK